MQFDLEDWLYNTIMRPGRTGCSHPMERDCHHRNLLHPPAQSSHRFRLSHPLSSGVELDGRKNCFPHICLHVSQMSRNLLTSEMWIFASAHLLYFCLITIATDWLALRPNQDDKACFMGATAGLQLPWILRSKRKCRSPTKTLKASFDLTIRRTTILQNTTVQSQEESETM